MTDNQANKDVENPQESVQDDEAAAKGCFLKKAWRNSSTSAKAVGIIVLLFLLVGGGIALSKAISNAIYVESPLVAAVKAGDLDSVERLLPEYRNMGWGELDEDGNRIMYIAAVRGHRDIVSLLIQGTNMWSHSNHADEHDWHHNHANDEWRRPLHAAAARGDANTVYLLTSTNYPGGAPDKRGRYPLHFAAENGHGDVCVRAPGGASTKDKEGKTAADLADANGHSGLALLLREVESAEAKADAYESSMKDRSMYNTPEERELSRLQGVVKRAKEQLGSDPKRFDIHRLGDEKRRLDDEAGLTYARFQALKERDNSSH